MNFFQEFISNKVRYIGVLFKETKNSQQNPYLPPLLQVPAGYCYNSRRITIRMVVDSSKGGYLREISQASLTWICLGLLKGRAH